MKLQIFLTIALVHLAGCRSDCYTSSNCLKHFTSYGKCGTASGCCTDSLHGLACYYTPDCGAKYCRGDTARCYS